MLRIQVMAANVLYDICEHRWIVHADCDHHHMVLDRCWRHHGCLLRFHVVLLVERVRAEAVGCYLVVFIVHSFLGIPCWSSYCSSVW